MSYLTTILADSPVAYWPLDDWKYGSQPTRALDAGPNAIHSNDFANITKVAGPIAGTVAGWFNGSTSGMTIPGNALLDLQTFTIEAWIKPVQVFDGASNAAQNGFIFEKTTNGAVNTQYAMFMEWVTGGNGYMVGRHEQPAMVSLNTGGHDLASRGDRWRHVTYQRRASDGYGAHLREGVLWWDSTTLGTGTIASGGGAAGTSFIGVYGGGGYRFKGAIAHVAVYGSFLTGAQLQAHVAAAGRDSVGY